MIVRNEDRFIWYAISSVLPYVDEFFIFDTGSTDKTVEMVRLFDDKKIVFEQKGEVDSEGITALRQEQIDRTGTNWIWIVDGDEVYPKKTAGEILRIVKGGKSLRGIIVHRYDLLGDIYHSQDETVGAYSQFGRRGHYVLRLIDKRSIKELQVLGKYPNEYFADVTGQSIKNHGREKFAFVQQRLFHAMYLRRSTQEKDFLKTLNRKTVKIELGKKIPREDLPEVFFKDRPSIVPDVVLKMSLEYKLLASVITPVKWLKRRIFPNFHLEGVAARCTRRCVSSQHRFG